ncbi:glycosyltransferase family 4 protein [Pseudooceanicola algae]|uniref:Uncharacterized protein n=1 Tax=Pseudooceanicola algae TaxID=1537215 RepID=A0A418SIQ9_9RHOB|nr:glycosyltransferase family 4 protein [Pseudooceanicola algae]QPM91192.1 hypothetical protein PSAL_024420 [Pseudooceanicola algae]
MIGGAGGHSGVPRHILQLVRALTGIADLTVASDKCAGVYKELDRTPARHVEVPGLESSVSPLRWLRAARHLRQLIGREQPALVWAHSRMAVFLLRSMALCGVLPGRPEIAVTFHGLPFGKGHRASALTIRAEKLFLSRLSGLHLLFLSKAAEHEYRGAVGEDLCLGHQISQRPNCSDIGEIKRREPDDTTRQLLMTGRAARQKNLPRALAIFAALPGTYRLTICGAGTETAGFRRKAKHILGPGPLSRVTFLGEVADIRPLLARADVYLLTSRYEGMPIAALEAFEAGLPLALSATGGTAEISARHPFCTELTAGEGVDDLQEDALRITALTEAFRAAPEQFRTEIRRAFQQEFSFAAWARDMRVQASRMCPPVPDPSLTPEGAANVPLPPIIPQPMPAGVIPSQVSLSGNMQNTARSPRA